MKTARFSEVVKKAGAPESYLLLGKPEKDRAFQAALKQQRIMSVHTAMHGGKKDYGTVGWTKEGGAQLLLFPRSLRRFTDRRIVGINYDLMAQHPEPKPRGEEKAIKREDAEVIKRKDAKARRSEKRNVVKQPKKRAAKTEVGELIPWEVPKSELERKRAKREEATGPQGGTRGEVAAPPVSAEQEKAREPIPAWAAREISAALRELNAGKKAAARDRLGTLVR
jgi:hypothetical protein